MNVGIAKVWNDTVGSNDLVYIVGDFCWRNHRKWINELNGKKVLLIGSHDEMPLDALELFKADDPALSFDISVAEKVKTLAQFREVHHGLVRKICGQMMHLYHWPLATWQGKPHGSWCITGHCHGRMQGTRPGEIGMGLILDVGWDVFQRPIRFEEVMAEIKIKFDKGATRYEKAGEVDKD
jgi:calcineurin-like phosphoesterase family protein